MDWDVFLDSMIVRASGTRRDKIWLSFIDFIIRIISSDMPEYHGPKQGFIFIFVHFVPSKTTVCDTFYWAVCMDSFYSAFASLLKLEKSLFVITAWKRVTICILKHLHLCPTEARKSYRFWSSMRVSKWWQLWFLAELFL